MRPLAQFAVLLAGLASAPAYAWTDHDLITRQALEDVPLMQTSVAAEPAEHFLASDPAQLAKVLDGEEAWARANLPGYPVRPDALRFDEHVDRAHAVRRFLLAIRVNPEARLRLFVQDLPGITPISQSKLPWTDVTTRRSETIASELSFSAVPPGAYLTVIDVIGTASDEPDYGLDIGLWDDNSTGAGHAYGFGLQPFGNPKLDVSTQAPFHMGFFHESWLLDHAAPYLKRALPEYRVHLYQTLASYAFKSGHPYWGWRFSGWALHYVEDLTQPYHTRALPGVGSVHILFASALDLIGIHGPKTDAIQLVSNRHLELENYEYHRLHDAMLNHDQQDALLAALANAKCDAPYGPWTNASLRNEVSLTASQKAEKIDAMLVSALPEQLVSDPRFVFTETGENVPNIAQIMQAAPPLPRRKFEAEMADVMCQVGAQTRRFVRSLPVYAPPPPQGES